jgi:hypothetical protein
MTDMDIASSGWSIIILGLDEDRLVPRASDVTKDGDLLPVKMKTIAALVGSDSEAVDVLKDWMSGVPAPYNSIGLSVAQCNKLQRERLFLRNRRIVSGYELLDRRLRAQLGGGDPDAVPPTWLTVGKWTAKTIGDLLYGDIPIPQRRWVVRKVLNCIFRGMSRWRTLAMGRIFILGNREIFTQIASALTIFTDIFMDTNPWELNLDFSGFISEYGKQMLGRGDPYLADELPFSVSKVTRDPLSDSMLRALYSYYRAIGASSERERKTWVLTGNLYLAAYEQHVAQTFISMGLRLKTHNELKRLLKEFKPQDVTRNGAAQNRPLDMLTERWFGTRLIDLAAAAFITRYILSIRVGLDNAKFDHTFAPANPLAQCEEAGRSVNNLIDNTDAGKSLQRVWQALDRAAERPECCRVRDWRNYTSRINYIANLFAVSVADPVFGEPVLSDDELLSFLRGRLPKENGIKLKSARLEAARAAQKKVEAYAWLDAARAARKKVEEESGGRHPASA